MAAPISGLILASAARTSSGTALVSAVAGTGTLNELSVSGYRPKLGRFNRALALLNVTAAATAGGDTLDVYLQKNVGPPSNLVWTDFVHFTQVLGNGGVKQHVAEIAGLVTPTAAMHAVQDAALSAGVNQGPWSDDWRIKWVVVGTGTFTFSIALALWGEE